MFKVSFIYQLYTLLEQDNKSIHWNKSGKSFIINNNHSFNKLLTNHFSSVDSIAAFQHQLSLHGFKHENNKYSHPEFQKGRKELVYGIRKNVEKDVMMMHMIQEQNEVGFEINM